jgi:hypothetical protein
VCVCVCLRVCMCVCVFVCICICMCVVMYNIIYKDTYSIHILTLRTEHTEEGVYDKGTGTWVDVSLHSKVDKLIHMMTMLVSTLTPASVEAVTSAAALVRMAAGGGGGRAGGGGGGGGGGSGGGGGGGFIGQQAEKPSGTFYLRRGAGSSSGERGKTFSI